MRPRGGGWVSGVLQGGVAAPAPTSSAWLHPCIPVTLTMFLVLPPCSHTPSARQDFLSAGRGGLIQLSDAQGCVSWCCFPTAPEPPAGMSS